MKTNALKVLLLTSLMAGSLASCNTEIKDSTSSSSTPAISDSSVEEEVSSSEVVSEEQSSSTETVENAPLKIDLNRTIYLSDETTLDYSALYIWSNAAGGYKELTSAPKITMPTGQTGHCKAKVISGTKQIEVDIQVYATAKEAALANPLSEEEIAEVAFKESKYIDVSKKKLKFDTLVEDGVLKAYVDRRSADYVDADALTAIKNPTNYSWATQKVFAFTSAESPCVSTLNPAFKTVPHEVAENGTDEYAYSTFNMATGSDVQYELIIDGEGYICYFALNFTNKKYTHILPTDTNWYASEKYSDPSTNPAFVFAETYDASDEVHKFDFEKVIPEGGCYFIATNNYATYGTDSKNGALDSIWEKAIDSTDNFYATATKDTFTKEILNQNSKLTSARFFYKNEYVLGEKFFRALALYNDADTYQTYAYYYQLALNSNDAEAIAYRDTVYDTIVYQKAEKVMAEKILLEYYQSQTSVVLNAWKEMVVKE